MFNDTIKGKLDYREAQATLFGENLHKFRALLSLEKLLSKNNRKIVVSGLSFVSPENQQKLRGGRRFIPCAPLETNLNLN